MDGISLRTSQMNARLTDSLGTKGISGDQLIQVPKNTSTDSASGASFADTLNQAIGKVNQLHQESDKGIQNLATGRSDNIADVMIAAEKADIALKVMVQVRNKIIDAYQEMMRMQV